MKSNWEKRERSNKMKALTVAVLVHALILMSLLSFSGNSDEGGLTTWIKSKFQKENVEQAEMAKS